MIYNSAYKKQVKAMLESIEPKVFLQLRPGEIRRISDNLLAEKTSDGRIILYEIIES